MKINSLCLFVEYGKRNRLKGQHFFDFLRSCITTLQGYRDNLLQLNNNNQSVQVINLFQQYGYQ